MNTKEIAKTVGCSAKTVRDRIKNGWTIEKILSTPQVTNTFSTRISNIIALIDPEYVEKFGVPKSPRDEIVIICPDCKNKQNIFAFSILKTVKKRGTYKCSSCISRSPEGRAIRAAQSKKAWSNPEIREKIISKNIEHSTSKEGRLQRSKQSKKAWENSEYAKFQRNRTKELFQSEEHRLLVSNRNKSDFAENSELYLQTKTSALRTDVAKENHKKALQLLEYKETHRKLALERFKNPEYKAKIAKSLEGFSRNGKESEPEKKVRSILESLGIEFVAQKAVGPYNFDFFIPSKNLYIEVQGEYWHGLPNNQRRDAAKYSYLRSAFPDSHITYVWDYDFLSPGRVENKLGEIIIPDISQNDFELKSVTFNTISQEEARKFLGSWHYAQFGKVGKFIYAAFLEKEIIAVAKFGPVSRKEIATSIGQTSKTAYELDRLCIKPTRQKKNFASYFLSRASKAFLNTDLEIQSIIAFSDITEGHSGTVYKACGWDHISTTRPDYVYVNSEGWMMHKKTLYNHAHGVHISEKEYAEKHSWNKVFGKEKLKFVLNRT